ATIPIGQGIATSALQMTLVYATIANNGVKPVPQLVLGGQPQSDTPRRVISSSTSASLRSMLTQVVERGTGTKAAVNGYAVAGKTGTARIPGPNGYTDQYVASFVGFAPADHPRVVVSVFLDRPETIFGGETAAPMFSDIARFALRHLRVAPSG